MMAIEIFDEAVQQGIGKKGRWNGGEVEVVGIQIISDCPRLFQAGLGTLTPKSRLPLSEMAGKCDKDEVKGER